MGKQNGKGMLLSIFLLEILGFISSTVSGDIRGVYEMLIKPPLSPPGWVFGVAWFILYALMGISVYLIYAGSDSEERSRSLELFGWQLAVNLIWPVFFFRWQLYWAAVMVILILDVLVSVTTIRFGQLNKIAGRLMIPYLLWIFYATYLNIGFAFLNF